MRYLSLLMLCMISMLIAAENGFAGNHRLGGGANYWVALDDIEKDNGDDIDENGLAFLVSYQYWPSILGLEVCAELLPDRFGETAIAPQAYVLFGSGLYAGAGIGTVLSDGEFSEQPFFALKAGINLELLPRALYVDVFANYRFNEKAELSDSSTDIDTDTVFLGAAARFAF